MSFQTTISSGSPFGLNYYVFTDERPYWEVTSEGRLDIFVGDMEAVHTSYEGTWVAVTVVEVTDDEEEDLPDLDEADLTFDAYFAEGQLAHESARGSMVHHVPTDIMVRCGSERSGIQNKVMALRLLQHCIKATS